MIKTDNQYSGLPWLAGGRTREGLDCVGLAELFLREQLGMDLTAPQRLEYSKYQADVFLNGRALPIEQLKRGDILFFSRKTGELNHVGIHLGEGKILHQTGGGSRIDNGLELLRRAKLNYVAAVPVEDRETIRQLLSVPSVREPTTLLIIGIVVAIGSAAASFAMRPKIPNLSAEFGRYAANGGFPMATLVSTESPLPDLLGQLTLAGNAVFQTPIDKSLTISDSAQQKISRVVVFSTAPALSEGQLKVNGISVENHFYGNETQGGVQKMGFQVNPSAASLAVDATIAGYTTLWSSYNVYLGGLGISVPVDLRAQYDRNFPIYGLPGCTYIVYRFVNASKFESGLNVTARVFGHGVREFTSSGFSVVTVTNESLTGADGTKKRFKLAFLDAQTVTALTVNGVTYTQIGPGNQAGNIFHLNKTKGFVEFMTAPAAAATILVSYKYYNRVWSQNPAEHIVYLLTETLRGKGIDESKINWASFVAERDYFNENVTWNTGTRGVITGPRYTCNYILDTRKPLSDHLRAILDACHSQLFLSGGKFNIRARKAGSSVFSFTEANILVEEGTDGVRSTFMSQLIDRSERSNRVHLFYHSLETFNAETGVLRDDPDNQDERAPRIGNDGVVDDTLKYLAVDSESQAERLAETILAEEVNRRWAIELKTNIKGLALEPTDIIDVTHSSQPSWAGKLFRIEEIGQDENDHMIIRALEYFEGAYI
jgi:hypothetical protein